MMQHNNTRGAWTMVLALAALTVACETPATKEKVAQLTAISAEKDSLLAMVGQNTRLMTEISREMARVREVRRPAARTKAAAESPIGTGSFRDSLMTKVKDVVERVNQSERSLAASQRRIRELTTASDSVKTLFEQTIADLQAGLESQRANVVALTAEVDSLKVQNGQLVLQTVALADTVQNLKTENNTVYYVIGTKDELKQRGIVVEEGRKFLVFGGKVLVPSRGLSPQGFTAIDRRSVSEIVLPDGKSYQIVSRQNLEYMGTPPSNGSKIQGSIRITQPDGFWAPSRYLIVVEG